MKNIYKITIWLRIILLLIPTTILLQNKFFIEAGLICFYVLYSIQKLRIIELEKRLDILENNEKNI